MKRPFGIPNLYLYLYLYLYVLTLLTFGNESLTCNFVTYRLGG